MSLAEIPLVLTVTGMVAYTVLAARTSKSTTPSAF